MFGTSRLVAIALCAALNIAIGNIVYLIKLPIYLDSVGTILCALLLFPDVPAAILCAFLAGAIGVVLTWLLVNPYLLYFMGTVLALALVSALLTARGATTFRTRPLPTASFVAWVASCGVVTGIVSAVVSAPVVATLFGGVTGSGSALVVAYFVKSGNFLWDATLRSGLIIEPIDKTLQVLLAALLYRATPKDFLAMLQPAAAPSAAR